MSHNYGILTSAVIPSFNGIGKENFKGLYDENGKLKEYINRIDPTTGIEYDENNNPTGRIDITYVSNNGTRSWFGCISYGGNASQYPMSLRSGLFGFVAGNNRNIIESFANGSANSATFRPVIWN